MPNSSNKPNRIPRGRRRAGPDHADRRARPAAHE